MNRYEVPVEDLTGKQRSLLIYAEDSLIASAKAINAGFIYTGSFVKEVGFFDETTCCIVGETYNITVEDKMYLIPSRAQQLKAKESK